MRASVTIQELDLSTRVPSFPGLYGGIVIPAKKGKVNEAQLATSETQLLKYWTPDETIKVGYSNAYYSAASFLIKSNKLWVVRAANSPFYGGCYLRGDAPVSIVGVSANNTTDVITLAHGTTSEIANAKAFMAMVDTTEKIEISTDGGSIPTGLSASTTYYLIIVDVDNYQVMLAASKADAQAGTEIDFSSNGSKLSLTLDPNALYTVNGEVEYGLSDPSAYVLNSSDGKPVGLSSTFTLDIDLDSFNASDAFYAMVATGDKIWLSTTGTFPVVVGAVLAAATDYWCIKVAERKEIKIARTLADANNDIPIDLVSDGTGTLTSTLQDKATDSAFTANATTDILTIGDTKFYAGCANNDKVQFTTTNTLPLGVAIKEQFTITCLAASIALGGKYFTFSSSTTDYYGWYQVGSDPVPDPAWTAVEVIVAPNATDEEVATATKNKLDALGDFGATVVTNTVTVTTAANGVTTNATDHDTGFTLAVTQEGSGAQPEITDVTCLGVSGNLIGSEYFEIYSAIDATHYYVYFVLGIDPAAAGTGAKITVRATDTGAAVASATQTILNALADLTSTVTDEVVTTTVDTPHDTTHAADFNTSFTISVAADGRDGTGIDFYVIKTATLDEIKITESIDGPVLDLTDTGAGTHTITQQEKEHSSTLVTDLKGDTVTVSATFYAAIRTEDVVQVSTTNTLPIGLTSLTDYYVIRGDKNKAKFATTQANAKRGIAIDLLSAGVGTQTVEYKGNTELLGMERKCLLIYACNQGKWSDDIYTKTLHYPYCKTLECDAEHENWTTEEEAAADLVKEPDCFLVYVYKRNIDGTFTIMEDPWLCSREQDKRDGYGSNVYVEDVLEGSNYVRATNNTAMDDSLYPKDQTTELMMDKGDDGGTVTDTHMLQALNAFENKRNIFVTLLLDGDWATPAYQKQGLLSLCETRQDCFAVLSCPISDEAASDAVTEILKYRKEELNANSSYGGLFTSHLEIQDEYNNRKIFVAPDGYVGAAISETASNYEMWYAAAGPRRGVLKVLDVKRRFTEEEMDVLYDNGVNPIDFYLGRGIRIWGQKTLLSRPSALDRMNVRFLLIVIEPAIAEFLEDFLFEFNDFTTRALVTSGIDSYMQNIKTRRGVYDYRVVCSEENNTIEDIDANKMNVWLYIQPVKVAEFIFFRVIITRTGASFSIG